MTLPREIEWPPGSGIIGSYGEREAATMLLLANFRPPTARREAETYHELIALLDAREVDSPDPAVPFEPREETMLDALSDPTVNAIGKAHANGAQTEIAAAAKVFPRSGTQRALILDGVANAYWEEQVGLIDEEISRLPGVADTAHRTRRNELVAGGWLEDSGIVRLTDSQTESIVWTITAAAKERLTTDSVLPRRQ